MSKLNKATSKLGSIDREKQQDTSNANPTPDGLITKKTAEKPTSILLTDEDKAKLARIVKSVNSISRTKVSKNKIIKALITMGANIPPDRIMKALRELI